jgi:hypothetical protein
MTIWNPAQELHQLLETGLGIKPELSAEQAWKELFSVNDLPDLLLVLDAVIKLPHQVRTFIEYLERDDQELLLTGLDDIDILLRTQQLSQPWGQVTSRLENLAVPRINLRHAASAIRQGNLEVSLQDDEISDLLDDLRVLIQDLEASALPKNLRQLLVAQLRDVETSMLRIATLGPEYAAENIDHVLGTLVRIEDTTDIPQEPLDATVKWLRRAVAVVNIVRVILEIKGIGHSLGTHLPTWFPPPELPPAPDGKAL